MMQSDYYASRLADGNDAMISDHFGSTRHETEINKEPVSI